MNKENVPWVEKYRPTKFDDIVLDSTNKEIFKNILKNNYFPNLLFYGPPGTGKTTTIINLINEYQKNHNNNVKGSVIHLNASDERGIDIIRNQIYSFVRTRNFFMNGLKFVILDEVDYMTKNAQQALKYLLQSNFTDVRFCLICNYISKIETSLKNEFLCIRFNQLPKLEVQNFIEDICSKENIEIDDTIINNIQHIYNSDIRSIINFIQLNQNIDTIQNNIINIKILDDLYELIRSEENINKIFAYIHNISIQYNNDKKNIILSFFEFLIRTNKVLDHEILYCMESIIHTQDVNNNYLLKYFIIKMKKFLS
tara:strand:- start:117 stop:1052 length:936 start_codon:yes stop_codon:yes gene_type:complete